MRDYPRVLLAALGIVAALVGGWLSVLASGPPRPLGADAPPEVFSATRAAATLAEISRDPRPMGTAAHRRTLGELRTRFERLGLETWIESSTVLRGRDDRIVAARVSNLLARLPGRGRPGALLLMAHYDSVPGSPGAGDDGSGVVALLETMRALAAGPQLARDVMVLLTDGEEVGLLGARAFVEDETRLSEIALVFNFEARGGSGPVLMFETAKGNHALVEDMARTVPRPIASSLSYEVYRRMPNDTDFSVLRRAGLEGLNFAMIGSHGSYHSRLDTLERLDRGSLQHHGSYALALARRFGDMEELPAAGADGVFFNGFGGHLFFSYSSGTARILGGLLVLLAGFALAVRSRRHRGRVAGIGWGLGLVVAAALAGPAAAQLVWRTALLLAPDIVRAPHGVPWIGGSLAVAGGLLTVALMAALVLLLSRLAAAADLWAGALLGWSLLGLATAFFVPGASYVFLWPSVAGWLGLLVAARSPDRERSWVLAPAISGLPAALLLAPVIGLFLEALTVRQAGPALALFALAGTLFTVPLAAIVGSGRGWMVVAGTAAAAAAVLLGAVLPAAPSAAAPATNHLLYALDADSGQALWLSSDRRPDSWTAGYLGSAGSPGEAPAPFTFLRGEYLQAEAPPAELPGPGVVVEHPPERPGHILLRLFSAREASVLRLRLASLEPFRLSRVDGREPPAGLEAAGEAGATEVEITFFAVPQRGLEVEIRPGVGELVLEMADQTYGFPRLAGSRPRRPADRIPRPSWTTDSTLVAHRVVLTADAVAPSPIAGGTEDG